MLEYVYKLNLPPVKEVLLPDLAETLLQKSEVSSYAAYNSKKIIKSEFLNIKNINWDAGVAHFHLTNGNVGKLHCDHQDPKEILMAAINWVYDGVCQMDYWEFDELPPGSKVVDINNASAYYWPDSVRPPPHGRGIPASKTYLMPTGAYLVNASVPHLAYGWGNRHVISMRSYFLRTKTWDYVVDLFDDLIIK